MKIYYLYSTVQSLNSETKEGLQILITLPNNLSNENLIEHICTSIIEASVTVCVKEKILKGML